jgi:hypothetical protein
VYRAEAVLFKLLGGKPKETNMKNSRGDVIKKVEESSCISKMELTFSGKIPTVRKSLNLVRKEGFEIKEDAEMFLLKSNSSELRTFQRINTVFINGTFYRKEKNFTLKEFDDRARNKFGFQEHHAQFACLLLLWGGEILQRCPLGILIIHKPFMDSDGKPRLLRVRPCGLDTYPASGNKNPFPLGFAFRKE